ncbi:hypothetical protein [uncultured Tenacibaculum sp.]|uniref:hypothetical protein n=1 Tax=uncultured Tenacibaculum sp. TaxID=174713 RepID=UPI00260A432C|nr:hypothetical protein [uncultured Tenacibaculum sp.]
MKKAILSVIGILAILLTFSFTNSNFDNERTIKITSEKIIEFDMVQNGIITKGIKTPHEFKFVGNEGNFIFKSKKEKEELKISVENKNGSLSAEWGIIVLTIENDEMKTFGMN